MSNMEMELEYSEIATPAFRYDLLGERWKYEKEVWSQTQVNLLTLINQLVGTIRLCRRVLSELTSVAVVPGQCLPAQRNIEDESVCMETMSRFLKQ